MNPVVRRIFHLVFDSANPRSLARWFRKRRLRFIFDTLEPDLDSLVLDVGSDGSFFLLLWPHPDRIVCLDNQFRSGTPSRAATAVMADVRALPFKDRSIDIIANSVLEHVGPLEEQRKAAAEIRRAGKSYFVQIPYLYFPIDPHFFTIPYFQLLPESWQRWICRRAAVGFVPKGGFLPVHYLTAAQLSALFPEARIVRERFFFLTKSLYAAKRKEGKQT
jgi:hypothetical protein